MAACCSGSSRDAAAGGKAGREGAATHLDLMHNHRPVGCRGMGAIGAERDKGSPCTAQACTRAPLCPQAPHVTAVLTTYQSR